jgi:Uma2 family endonuclease
MPITTFEELDLNKHYTYADYLTWRFKERVELIKGRIFKMSPAPGMRHQKIAGTFYGHIWTFLKGKPCLVFSAPFDVRLPLPPKRAKGGKVDTVVQPDIVVVCDEDKLDERGCFGAPDMVVEILSRGNSRREMHQKFDLYEHAGVTEYWVVDPLREMIIVYTLEKGRYYGSRPYLKGDVVPSGVLDGFLLDTTDILNEPAEELP